jgi:5,10-methylene-tetrahydrofolate dehydrogenase/methenyl tetrahydrofolate cyclohydrolase
LAFTVISFLECAGNAIAAQIRTEIAAEIADLAGTGLAPGLAVILVGQRKDSATYVRMKKKACTEVGMASFGIDYPDSVTEEELLDKGAVLSSFITL